ncbi:MAG: Sulfatase-modifying factor enzyme 1, partial [Candidatus Kentron sp. G]
RGQKLRRVVHYSPYFCPHRALQGHNRSATSKTRISKQLLKEPNPWGLFDMLGNVREWTQDPWPFNYRGAPTDGTPWEASSEKQKIFAGRVFRGGSWYDDARFVRAATAAGRAIATTALAFAVPKCIREQGNVVPCRMLVSPPGRTASTKCCSEMMRFALAGSPASYGSRFRFRFGQVRDKRFKGR